MAGLGRADLSEADLHWANLRGANMEEATLSGTSLASVDLSAVKGLESVDHRGPSTVGIDTFFQSKGNIPEVFLRGVGVAEVFITYA